MAPCAKPLGTSVGIAVLAAACGWTAAARAEAAATDAEIERAVASIEAEDPSSHAAGEFGGGRPLKLYGFLEAGFHKLMVPETSFLHPLVASNSSTFVLGNINLFLDAQPHEDWRGLVELRFTNEPHGQDRAFASALGGEYERIDNRATDSGSPNGRQDILLGNVVIERAFIEWMGSDELRLKAGYWLTPFGIWNLDHGSPTLISLLLPDLQLAEYAPSKQLGIEASGSIFSGDWEHGYHAYISNGRTPGQQDLTDDKALGGRLFTTHIDDGERLTLGLSGYYGTYAETEKRIVSFDPFRVEIDQTIAATEWAAGADLALDAGDIRLRTEAAVRRITYDQGRQAPPEIGRPDAFVPDHYRWSWYGLAAHRLPWGGLEPYLWLEVIHRPSGLGDTIFVPSVGMNVHFAPEVQLKLQYSQVRFTDLSAGEESNPSQHDFAAFVSKLVLAF